LRGACIDIGSNTTRLLVAETGDGGAHLRKLQEQRVFTHLRRSLRADGTIDAAAIDEQIVAVKEQLAVAHALAPDRIAVVATAAVRCARNAAALTGALRDRCGVTLQILSEHDEARLAFRGACAALAEARCANGGGAWSLEGELGVVDVGGGSSELVVGTAPDRVRWAQSRQLGSGNLSDAWFHSDPPTAAEVQAARAQVAELLGAIAVPRPALAVAVGGSAASLRPLAGRCLDAAALGSALDLLLSAPAAEVARDFHLDVQRVRLLPAGLLILQAAQERFGVPLRVVCGGLREGVLLELGRG
jgi:exopolyphosphatase/guanosine-5'-triphosphate,3'-diphosphate pyrophosphatase